MLLEALERKWRVPGASWVTRNRSHPADLTFCGAGSRLVGPGYMGNSYLDLGKAHSKEILEVKNGQQDF